MMVYLKDNCIMYSEFHVGVRNYIEKEIDFDEAINKLFGYIKCMVDMELIESDRAEEEMNIATKKLLDSK